MAFHEIQLDPNMMYGLSGGPKFSTLIQSMSGGDEQRISLWPIGRHEYNVGYDVVSRTQLVGLLNFFWARGGMAYGWRMKDWFDYTAITQPITINPGGLSGQLTKVYGDSAYTRTRNITKPISGTSPTWTHTGIIVYGLSSGTVACDYTTGVVTFSVSQTGPLTWSGEFDVPVRFNTDWMEQVRDDFDIAHWSGLNVIEIRDFN